MSKLIKRLFCKPLTTHESHSKRIAPRNKKFPLWQGILIALLPGLGLFVYLSFYPVSAGSLYDIESEEVIVDMFVMNFDSDRHSNPCPAGYDWDDTDINEGAKGRSIYLCYKKGRYPLFDAITNVTLASDRDDSNVGCPSGYNRVFRAALGSDNTGPGSGDLNAGAGGSYIYLCTKKLGTGAPLIDVNVRKKNGGDFQCRYEIGSDWDGAGKHGPLGTETDLNAGVTPPGELHDYIHFCYKDMSSVVNDRTAAWCGGDEEDICRPGTDFAVLNGSAGGCDRGLEQDGINIDSATCDNGSGEHARRQSTARNFQDTWNYWALKNQRQQLNWNVPISKVMLLGAHNAFNNKTDGYPIPNQEFSITDVLRAGIRVVDLDIHESVEPERTILCHGSCSATDRFFYNAIKEIRDWMMKDENRNEVIVITLEDYLDDDDKVNIPIRVFLDRPDIGVFTPADYAANDNGFRSQSWMVENNKRVVLLAQSNRFGDRYVFKKTTAVGENNPQVSVRAAGRNNWSTSDIDRCTINELEQIGNGEEKGVRVDPEGSLFSEVYETRITAENDKGYGRIDRHDLAGLAKCNIKIINLDQVLQQDTDRFKGAVWSWTEGDWGNNGDAAVMRGSTGRWVSADPGHLKHFACRTAVGDGPTVWNVTTKAGPWVNGWETCQAEYPGSEFTVPISGWENEKLKLANAQHEDLWLNYNDIRDEGNWVINKPPAMSVEGPATVDEGKAFGEAFLVSINDEDARNLSINEVSCGNSGALTQEERGVILPGSSTATVGMWCKFPEGPATSSVSLKATDSLGVSATVTYDVTIKNVAPRITGRPMLDYSVIDENGWVTLSGSFTDPGLLDPHTVKINWGDGSSSSTVDLQPAVGTFSLTHQYLDDDPTGTTSDIWPLTIKVSDDDGGSDLAVTTVIINNVAPVASLNVLGTAVVGGGPPIVLTYDSVAAVGSFTDVGTKDTHNSTINWGDGSPLAAQLSASHFYVTPGIYTIMLTVTDDDKGVGATNSQVKVVNAQEALLIARDALLLLLNQGSLNQSAREAINRALDDLRGQAGGQASNGASDLLAKGNNNAALEKIKHALSELDRAGPIATNPDLAQIKLLLALTARSVAMEAITRASATSRQKIVEAEALVSQGDALLSGQSFWGAAEKYQAAGRKL